MMLLIPQTEEYRNIRAFVVNVLPPIEAGASWFYENSTTDSEELQRLTLSPQA